MIKVSNVTMYYGKYLALQDVSFEVDKGQIVAFIGPNGAGKTTTMRIITGFLSPTYGDVFVNGMNVFEERENVKSIVGYLPEKPPLYPELTVQEYLQFVGEIKKMERSKIAARVTEVMEMTDLIERRNTMIAYLSKGLKQRVGIAQSILNYPEVLILDEPTVGLDPKQVIDIRNLVLKLAKTEKRTVILSTHILAEASEICEKAIIINEGKIIAEDSIDKLRNTEKEAFSIHIKTLRNRETLREAIRTVSGVKSVEIEGAEGLEVTASSDVRETISKMAVERDAGLIELYHRRETLEDVFIKLVKSDNNGAE